MNGEELREARLARGWTQEGAAERLGVTQAYLSMLESGRRVLPRGLVRLAVGLMHAPATALPLPGAGMGARQGSDRLRAALGALGYPGFAHVRSRVRPRNPADVLLGAVNEAELDSRVVEALPWLTAKYANMDWEWLVRNAKLIDVQNRLGFLTEMAAELAAKSEVGERARKLKEYAGVFERSRLAREDTLCHESMTEAERKWLREHRSAQARHWNLLTDLRAERLGYGVG